MSDISPDVSHNQCRRARGDFPPYMARAETSQYFKEVWGLDIARATLAKLAVIGGGPTIS